VILNRREAATVIAGLRPLAGDGVRVRSHPHVLVAGLCDETEPEYDLRFEADEEYLRELIDRIDEMSLRGVKLCNRCTEKHTGKWKENSARRSARTVSGMLSDILFCRKVRLWRGGRAVASSKADERELDQVIVYNGNYSRCRSLRVEVARR